jgi:hypothetical protein
MDVTRKTLLSILKDTECFFGLSLMIPELADSLGKQEGSSVSSTLKALRTVKLTRVLNILLHTIAPETMQSILAETVAYDFHPSRQSKPPTLGGDHGGTYVAALSIAGRQGRFLTRLEIGQLVDHLQRYVADCEHWCRSKRWTGAPGEAEHIKAVRAVDGSWMKGAKEDPVCGKSKTRCAKIRKLVAMLRKRDDPALDPALDPAGDTQQKQSPLMVGCSRHINSRVKHHHAMKRGPSQTTYTWALMQACIVRCLDLEVEVHTIPAVIAFDSKHLELSEILMTTLCRSLVSQLGYNVMQAGTQKAVKLDFTWGEHLIMHQPWFKENLDRTLAFVADIDRAIDVERTLRDLRPADLRSKVRAAASLLADIDKLVAETRAAHAKAQEALDERRAYRDELRDRLQRRIDTTLALEGISHVLASLSIRE